MEKIELLFEEMDMLKPSGLMEVTFPCCLNYPLKTPGQSPRRHRDTASTFYLKIST